MTAPGYDWRRPSPVSDVDVAFPARALEIMPTVEECDAALSCMNPDVRRKWMDLQRTWFFHGLPPTVEFILAEVDGQKIDGDDAIRHLKVIQGSFAPKHEHKVVAFTYLASLWFRDYNLEGWTRKCARCGTKIIQDEQGSWVDDTDGDGCDDGVHTPDENASTPDA